MKAEGMDKRPKETVTKPSTGRLLKLLSWVQGRVDVGVTTSVMSESEPPP